MAEKTSKGVASGGLYINFYWQL